MIPELVQVETYFGRSAAVLSLDELVLKFGGVEVGQALQERFLELRCLPCRTYAVLTDKARKN